MKNFRKIATLLSLSMLSMACNKQSEAVDTRGTIRFEASMQDALYESRAGGESLLADLGLVPADEDLLLSISGSYVDSATGETMPYTYGPQSLTQWDAEAYMYASDDYTATVTCGEKGAEGLESPYFSGSVEFEVVARGSVTEQIEVAMSNSVIVLDFDDIFCSYYSDVTIHITTSAGAKFDFTPEDNPYVFVEAGSALTLSGEAINARTGASVTFSPKVIGSSVAQTLSVVSVSADSVGGSTINITLNGSLTEIEPIIVELNPQDI